MADTIQHDLLIKYSFLIKLMNKYDGLQAYETKNKLFADVLNPERRKLRLALETLGVNDYTCEHGKKYGLHQLCCCENKRPNMPKSELITKKLEELTELARVEGEPNVQAILLSLNGARISGDDGLLCANVQEFTRDVLLPRLAAARENNIAKRN